MGAYTMTTELNRAFATAIQSKDASLRFAGETSAFIWQAPDNGLFQSLYDAVSDIRQRLAERGLPAGTRAARDGQQAVADFLTTKDSFTQVRDSFGLDAGYYIARSCLNYDFIALGEVERIGAIAHVEPMRYYNQTPNGTSLFRAALGAGLRFTEASDSESRSAGFYVARCGDPEIVALYRQAGGTFRPTDLEVLSERFAKTA